MLRWRTSWGLLLACSPTAACCVGTPSGPPEVLCTEPLEVHKVAVTHHFSITAAKRDLLYRPALTTQEVSAFTLCHCCVPYGCQGLVTEPGCAKRGHADTGHPLFFCLVICCPLLLWHEVLE